MFDIIIGQFKMLVDDKISIAHYNMLYSEEYKNSNAVNQFRELSCTKK